MIGVPALHAWVDESTRRRASGTSVYVLAATICGTEQADEARRSVRALRLPELRFLHWHEEDRGRRLQIATVISGLEALHTVVVGAPVEAAGPERARSRCLARLATELAGIGVEHMLIEGRTALQNRRDVATITDLRSHGAVPKPLTVDFAGKSDDPMLWIADIVAGAVGASLTGTDAEPLDALGPSVEVIRIGLTQRRR
ncbi:MAG: hypothetical protein QM582_16385 [Micropruina sp.]|uniref:hypothetical protein n=1 Tax=Micropruina sp. TaxID=2737536 RepID=UPI0039E3BB2F